MKILYVSTISNTINAFLVPHIKYLISQGNQVDVAFNLVQEVDSELIKMGCKIHKVSFERSPLKYENIKGYQQIKSIIKSEGYDLVHTHTPIASFLTRFSCRSVPNIKVLYTAHGYHFFKGSNIKNWIIYYTLEKFASKMTDCLITINSEDYSNGKKMRLKKDGQVHHIHGVGVDLNKFMPQTNQKKTNMRREYGFSDDDFILMYAAELNYTKQQDLIFRALRILKKSMPNIKLLLAGNGILLNSYKSQVESLGLNDQVYFLGFRKDIAELLSISDVAVSSSRREGLPVNIIEAMATGLPIVVTGCRGNRDLVNDGENGYVVDTKNEDEFARAIEKLYNSKKIRDEFGKQSVKLVEKYSINNVLEEISEIYKLYS